MATFRRITKRDDPQKLAEVAARHQALLTEALAIAVRIAERKPQIVREILATGTAEGLVAHSSAKMAALRFHASKFRRTWNTLIPWESLDDTTADEEATSIIDTIETNIRMTETDSWPRRAKAHARKRRNDRNA
jgi:hypothetical protein